MSNWIAAMYLYTIDGRRARRPGNNLSLSSPLNSHKHTAQSNGSLLPPLISWYANTGRASMKAWSRLESCRWNNFCSYRSIAASRAPGRCGDVAESPLEVPRWCCFFISSLTRRWSRPEMKKMTARITMMSNIAGPILPLPPPLPPAV
jgi:hypothetical protein